MKNNYKQSTFLADKELLKEFSILCTKNETTKTKLIVNFIKECVKENNR